MDVRRKVAGRWVSAGIAIAVAFSPATAGAIPGAPAQPEPESEDRASTEALLVDVDALVATNAAALSTALGDLSLDVTNQLAAYTAVKAIRWRGAWCRKDIADKAVWEEKVKVKDERTRFGLKE